MSSTPIAHASSTPHAGSFRRRPAVRVRWGALAAGSAVGIAAWATLYVMGAAVMRLTGTDEAQAFAWTNIMWGLYGGLAAGAALWAGSAIASIAAGARCRTSGVLHGLVMWGMANITLVLAVGVVSLEASPKVRGPLAYLLHMGAVAVSGGGDVMGQGAASWSVGCALGGMIFVMLTSLALGVWGGIWGALQPTSEGY